MAVERLFTEEVFGLEVKPLEETPQGFIFEATLATLGAVNKNNRLYEVPLVASALESAKPLMRRNAGRLEHPEVGAEEKPIPLSENAIRWLDYRIEGNSLLGKGLIIETPDGLALKANIKAGVDVGFSTRGYGQSERRIGLDGRAYEHMTSYRFESVDAVASPSNYGTGIINFTGESTSNQEVKSKMNEVELVQKAEAARADKVIAESATATYKAELEALKATHKVVSESLTAAQTENATLKAENLKLQESQRANAVAAKLESLTSGDRFAAGIRTHVEALAKAFGQSVNESNVEALVTMVRPMVESAAAAGNSDTTATPRGQVGSASQVNESTSNAGASETKAVDTSPIGQLAANTYAK